MFSKYSSPEVVVNVLNIQVNLFTLDTSKYREFMYLVDWKLIQNFLCNRFVSVKLKLVGPFVNLIQVKSIYNK